ncbi:MAG: hypothetical protein LBP41_03710 [Holosporaceae bacterium]|jgi:hypothetical protein|nr:hypothetical protein [Holosporaceae bacterium]
MIKFLKRSVFVVFCASCSRYETPDLPDLDSKSFSYEEVMQKQTFLKKRVGKARQLNAGSTERRSYQ